ncbi:MAG: TraB/GumN family protein [Chitinophagaceae bacterium]|nr:TraB/GumN family protein [Chitinophagaceae bacterium]
MISLKVFLCVLMTVIVSIVQGQAVKQKTAKPKTKIPASDSGKLPSTLLWEITGNGLQQPSYLFGTMHILCAEDARVSENLKSVIKKSARVYFEIDMDDMTQMMSAMKYLRMNDGVKLSDLLTADEYTRVENHLKKSSTPMPISMINRFKPYFISGLLSEQMMNCKKKNGMEELIMKEAGAIDRPIFGLETVEYQAGLFDSIPYDKQAKELVTYIDSMENYKKSTAEMVDVYKKQDLERMDSLTRVSEPGLNEYMDLLLYNRNKRWVQQMPLIMRESTTLFAVGAGHLPGTDGVIKLLRRNGYTVKPMVN